MRMNRTLAAVIAFAMLGLVPFVSNSTAVAATRHSAVAASQSAAASATAERRRLPEREIVTEGVVKGQKLILKGRVKGAPKYARRLVKIERRIGRDGNWRTYRKLKSQAKGGFRTQVGAPRTGKWFFRAVTPKTNSHRRSHSNVLYSYTY